jgi:hypothetical protein
MVTLAVAVLTEFDAVNTYVVVVVGLTWADATA